MRKNDIWRKEGKRDRGGRRGNGKIRIRETEKEQQKRRRKKMGRG